MNYLFWKDQLIPIAEIDRLLKSNLTIFIQLKDKEIFELDFDSEIGMNVAYDEINKILNDDIYYDLGSY
jgi:hypothetical protein